MHSQNDNPPDISGFAPYHSKFALSALARADDSKLSHDERKEHVERAHQAVDTAIILRETLQPGAFEAGEGAPASIDNPGTIAIGAHGEAIASADSG